MPLKPGRHAAGDGSFGRSAGMAAGRGAAVLLVAVVIGILLLNKVDDSPGRQISTGDSGGNDTEETTTTTAAAPVPTTLPARPPGEVKVLSANGTKVSGAAGRVRDTLKALGYNVLSPIETKQAASTSAVFFAPGFDREAQVVAEALKLPPTSVKPLPGANEVPVSDLRGANVVAVVGPELTRSGGASTTTTARRTSTTARRATSSTSSTTSTTARTG